MKKVLIVEDEKAAMDRILSMDLWKGGSFTVCGTASNGREGFELFEKADPDIIITDIEMPVMNGLDLIEKIRLKNEDIPVIILSCYESFSYAQRAIRLNVRDYLIKDFLDPGVLYTTLKSVSPGSGEAAEDGALGGRSYDGGILFSVLEERDGDALAELEKRFEGTESFSLLLARPEKDHTGGKIIRRIAGRIAGGLESGADAVVSVIDNETVAVLMASGDRTSVSDTAVRMIDRVKDTEGAVLTVAAGSPFGSMGEIFGAYESAGNLLGYRIFLGHGRVILPESIDSIIWMDPAVTEALLDNLRLSLMEDDKQSFLRGLKSLFSIDTPGMIQYNYINHVNMKLAALLINYADEQHMDSAGIIDPEEMLSLETVEEIRDWFAGRFIKIFDGRKNGRFDGGGNFHVREAVRIIDTRYAGNLSLESLAENLGLHKVYLGRLFKKETGMTCLEYIQKVRVGKAKELLLSSSKTIGAVAAETGFSSYDHLAVVFKKLTGLTPGDFRKKYR